MKDYKKSVMGILNDARETVNNTLKQKVENDFESLLAEIKVELNKEDSTKQEKINKLYKILHELYQCIFIYENVTSEEFKKKTIDLESFNVEEKVEELEKYLDNTTKLITTNSNRSRNHSKCLSNIICKQ